MCCKLCSQTKNLQTHLPKERMVHSANVDGVVEVSGIDEILCIANPKIQIVNQSVIDGEFEFIGKETMTFSEFVFSYYDEACGVGEVDFYNMAAAEMSSAIENRVILSDKIVSVRQIAKILALAVKKTK